MAPPTSPSGQEPHKSTKPEPLGNAPFVFLFTTCTLCVLFLLWRRASEMKRVVQHRLETWKESRHEGRIRLSIDDGPPAASFLTEEDYDDDPEQLAHTPTAADTPHHPAAESPWADSGR